MKWVKHASFCACYFVVSSKSSSRLSTQTVQVLKLEKYWDEVSFHFCPPWVCGQRPAWIVCCSAELCDYELQRARLRPYDKAWKNQSQGNECDPGSRWGGRSAQQQEKRRLLLVLHLERGGWQISIRASLISVESRISPCGEIEE